MRTVKVSHLQGGWLVDSDLRIKSLQNSPSLTVSNSVPWPSSNESVTVWWRFSRSPNGFLESL